MGTSESPTREIPETLSSARRRAQRLSARSRSENARRREIDKFIARLVDEAPPLTAEQTARLATLLAAPSGGDRT